MISILIPTRDRYKIFIRSIDSLFKTCDDVNNFEVLVAIDTDDIDSNNEIFNYALNRPNIKCFLFERKYYTGLHIYINKLCTEASGDFLFLWNDDAIMNSDKWDKEIIKNKKFQILSPVVYGMPDFVLFPIIPKKWVEITGRWAPYHGLDSWIDLLGKKLNIINKSYSINITHDRHDITGNNYDTVYLESRGKGIDISGHLLEMLNEDYNKICEYLSKDN